LCHAEVHSPQRENILPSIYTGRKPVRLSQYRWHPFSDLATGWRFGVASTAVAAVLAGGCRTPVFARTQPDYAYTQRDSLQQAYRAGFIDARRLVPNRYPTEIAALAALPASILLMSRTKSVWSFPIVYSGVGLGGFVWSSRRRGQPLPVPPDSMRAHHAFESEVMWQRYRFGFSSAIEQRIQREHSRSERTIAISALMALIILSAQ